MGIWQSHLDEWLTETLRWPSWRVQGDAGAGGLSDAMVPVLAEPNACPEVDIEAGIPVFSYHS